jgi:hypothetical protein
MNFVSVAPGFSLRQERPLLYENTFENPSSSLRPHLFQSFSSAGFQRLSSSARSLSRVPGKN